MPYSFKFTNIKIFRKMHLKLILLLFTFLFISFTSTNALRFKRSTNETMFDCPADTYSVGTTCKTDSDCDRKGKIKEFCSDNWCCKAIMWNQRAE